MLRYHFLFQGLPIPDTVIVGVVDDVMIPLLTGVSRVPRFSAQGHI